jgi:G6PDH family F420-dependent oxidoreductase
MGAAMQPLSLPFSMVCAPGQRYHPAIAAQAIATLAEMFPGRLSVELGSGEALNEMITGTKWPSKKERNERLLECVTIIRRLLAGEEVTYRGHVTVHQAKLYSLPSDPPLLFGAAISEETARWCGSWADGLLTTASSGDEARNKFAAYVAGGGTGKPLYIQFSFSYHPSKEIAMDEGYDQWRVNLLNTTDLANLHKPEHFDEAAAGITREQFAEKLPIFTSIDELFDRIQEFEAAGASRIILHNVNRRHEQFIEDFGQFRSNWRTNKELENSF